VQVPNINPTPAEERVRTNMQPKGKETKGLPKGAQEKAERPDGGPEARLSWPESNRLNNHSTIPLKGPYRQCDLSVIRLSFEATNGQCHFKGVLITNSRQCQSINSLSPIMPSST
jgi:hypothetical protein